MTLVEKWGIANTPDKTGMNPSTLAREKGYRRIADIIEAGVNMYRKNWQMGWTMARTGKGILKRFVAHRKDADPAYLFSAQPLPGLRADYIEPALFESNAD